MKNRNKSDSHRIKFFLVDDNALFLKAHQPWFVSHEPG